MNISNLLNVPWAEKYRPKTIAEIVMAKDTKAAFEAMVEDDSIPPLLLVGKPGTGKTTAALALVSEKDADSLFINASLDRNIDTLRNEISNFASASSFNGKRRYVILDEADHLNPQSVQPALRAFMEQFSSNCGFILAANYENKIIEPLRDSRCNVIRFSIPKDEEIDLASEMMTRAEGILKNEGVSFDPDVLPDIIMKFFPNFRKIVTKLQYFAMSGDIDSRIIKTLKGNDLSELVGHLHDKSYKAAREWYMKNSDYQFDQLVRELFDGMKSYVVPSSRPVAINLFNDYLCRFESCIDPEIHVMSMFVDLMRDVEWTK